MDPSLMFTIRSIVMAALLVALVGLVRGDEGAVARGRVNPFREFPLPAAWQARFWADARAKKLLALDARAIAELVPVQAGLRFCRCPGCGALEAENTLTWSFER